MTIDEKLDLVLKYITLNEERRYHEELISEFYNPTEEGHANYKNQEERDNKENELLNYHGELIGEIGEIWLEINKQLENYGK